MAEYRYRAFISYSWTDAKWGKWLHQQLETYRTPAALVGKQGTLGPVPARLHPIFKDREEEAAGASIGAAVESALASSQFLIVVCSPNSARSPWVEREIAWFKANRNPDRVLALIVDGEPGDEENKCFPRALTHHVSADGVVGEPLADAPLAADARIEGDGKRRAKLKLAAAMLGVGLDELVNRDERRRTIRTRVVVAASLALAAVMAGMALAAINARNEAEFQRNEADGLVEFMLTDLRDKLEPVGRLDALDVVGARALEYYAAQKLDRLDADALGRRARALLLVGEISNLRGDSDEALAAFSEAAATTAEQLARDPDNGQRIYDHAQSVFWVGAIAYNRGELDDAEAQFREYQRLAGQLVALDPDNPESQLESSYAETNMGVMLQEQDRLAEAETAFETGLSRMEAVVASEDYDPGRQVELGQIVNWLGIVRGKLQKHRESLALHQREVEIYDQLIERDPANRQAQNRLSIALQFVGKQQFNLGNPPEAVAAYNRSIELNAELRALEPENTEWQETAVRAQQVQAEQLLYMGRSNDCDALLQRSRELLSRMIATDPENEFWTGELRFTEAKVSMMLALGQNDLQGAEDQAEKLNALFGEGREHLGQDMASIALRLLGDLHRHTGQQQDARANWEQALALLPEDDQSVERYILLKRLDRLQEASELALAFDRRGFRHPAYLAESVRE